MLGISSARVLVAALAIGSLAAGPDSLRGASAQELLARAPAAGNVGAATLVEHEARGWSPATGQAYYVTLADGIGIVDYGAGTKNRLTALSVPGYTITAVEGLDLDPVSGDLWCLFETSETPSGNLIGSIDRGTGTVTPLFETTARYLDFAFWPDGTPYAVTNDEVPTNDVLIVALDRTTGAGTTVVNLGPETNGNQGEALCYSVTQELLFRISGRPASANSQIQQYIDPLAGEVVLETNEPFDTGLYDEAVDVSNDEWSEVFVTSDGISSTFYTLQGTSILEGPTISGLESPVFVTVPNDGCEEANYVAGLPFADVRLASLATSDPGDPVPSGPECAGLSTNRTLWYVLDADEYGSQFIVDASQSDYEVGLVVLEDSCNGPQVACGTGRLVVVPSPYHSYYIMAADTEGGMAGDRLRLEIRQPRFDATDGTLETASILTWDPSGAEAVDAWRITRHGSDGAVPIAALPPGDSLFVDTTGKASERYRYELTLVDRSTGFEASVSDSGHRAVFAPNDLSASDRTREEGILLHWNDLSSIEDRYRIYRRAGGTTDPFVVIDSTDADFRGYLDMTPLLGERYEYCIEAVSADGGTSERVCGAEGERGELTAPNTVAASNGVFPDSVVVTWNDESLAEEGYYVSKRPAGTTDPFVLLDTLPANSTRYVDTAGLGSPFTYRIVAFAAGGTLESEPGFDDGIGGPGTMAPPIDPVASNDDFDDSITLIWVDPGNDESKFIVYREGAPIGEVVDPVFVDTDVAAGVTIEYCIVAASDAGGTSPTDGACVSGRRSVILAPIDVAATQNDHEERVEIDWDTESTTTVLFELYRDGLLLQVLPSSARSFIDRTGQSGVEYGYQLRALTVAKESSDTTPTVYGARRLTAPESVSASNAIEKKIQLSWSDKSSFETGYEVRRREATGDSLRTLATLGRNQSSYADSTADVGVDYEYAIVPVDDRGADMSPIVWVPGRRDLAPVGDLTATDGDFEEKIVLSWIDQSAAETAYEIWRDGSYLAQIGADLEEFEDLSLSPGVSHTYQVFASDIAAPGTGPLSAPDATEAGGSTVVLPPGSVSASDTYEDKVTISWVDRSGIETGYEVGYLDAAGSYQVIATTSPDVTSFEVPSFLIGEQRQYGVRTMAGASGSVTEMDWGQVADAPGESPLVVVDAILDDYLLTDSGFRTYATNGNVCVLGDSLGVRIYNLSGEGVWELTQEIPESQSPSELPTSSVIDVAVDGNWMAVVWEAEFDGDLEMYRFDGSSWYYHSDPSVNRTTRVDVSGDRMVYSVADVNGGPPNLLVFWTYAPSTNEWETDATDVLLSPYVAIDGDIVVAGSQVEIRSWEYSNGLPVYQGAIPNQYSISNFGASGITLSNGRVAIGGEGETAIYDLATSTTEVVPYGLVGEINAGAVPAIDGDFLVIGDNAFDTPFPLGVFFDDPENGWTEKLRIDSSTPAIRTDLAFEGGTLLFGDRSRKRDVFVTEVLAPPSGIEASDNAFDNKVRISWQDRSRAEDAFRIYRDGEPLAEVPADTRSYNDFDARPGVAHVYEVAVSAQALGEISVGSDIGRRPADGFIGGRVTTRAGTGVQNIEVCLEPPISRSLVFDGNGGVVTVKDYRLPEEEMTLDLWATMADLEGTTLRWLWRNDTGSVRFGTTGGEFVVLVDGALANFPLPADRNWHHYAITADFGNEFRFFQDGVQVGSPVSLTSNPHDAQPSTVRIGGDTPGVSSLTRIDTQSWLGQIDEVRIWSRVRTPEEIADGRALRPTPGTPNLATYWAFDEPDGAVTSDLTSGGYHGWLIGGVSKSDFSAPVQVCAVSDFDGNYSIPGILYGDGATFQITPGGEGRTFEPRRKFITIDQENPLANEVGFTDVTSFSLAGYVGYENTACPATRAEIYVDGELVGSADSNGEYEVAVLPGAHVLEVRIDGQTLSPETYSLDVSANTGGLDFEVTTKRRLALAVGGGCPGIEIGSITLNIMSSDGCYQATPVVLTDSDELLVPPLEFRVEVAAVTGAPAPLSNGQIQEFFDAQGPATVDLSTSDGGATFLYRAPISLAIEGLTPPSCSPFLGPNGETIATPDAFLEQGSAVDLTFTVFEDYGAAGQCFVDSGTVTLYNEITDIPEPIVLPVVNGVATYSVIGNTPNPYPGRTDTAGNSRSYQKALFAVAEAGGQTDQQVRWFVVTGSNPRSGTFYSAISEEVPLLILHDPPGDDSYSFYEEGVERCRELRRTEIDGTNEQGKILGKWGTKFEAGSGFLNFETKAVVKAGYGFEHRAEATSDGNLEYCVRTTQRFSTSADDSFVGPTGDVFVGSAINVLFAPADKLEVDDQCRARSSQEIRLGIDGRDPFPTTFAYSGGYIERILIPRLGELRDIAAGSSEPENAVVYESQIENWRAQLDLAAQLTEDGITESAENRSFSAGAIYQSSVATETSQTSSYSNSLYTNDAVLAEYDIAVAEVGSEGGLKAGWSFQTVGTVSSSSDSTVTTGYVLADNDIGDYFTADIGVDPVYGTPVFDLVSGTSSCPWEYGTEPRDSVSFVLSPVLNAVDGKVPASEPAEYTLTMTNHSRELREYYLRSEESENPGGAVIRVNGSDAAIPRSFFLGAPPNNVRDITVTVERGPRMYSYPSLRLQAVPPCELDLFRSGDRIGDPPVPRLSHAVTFSAEFEAPCSDVTISEPESGDSFNRLDSDNAEATYGTKDLLLIRLDDFVLKIGDTTEDLVDGFNVEWRRVGSPINWQRILNDDLTAEELGVGGSPNEPRSDYDLLWDVPGDAEGNDDEAGMYELRAYSLCGTEFVYSNVVGVRIDRQDPRPFGDPEPADEVLALGDAIEIVFDEPIDCNTVNSQTIRVTVSDPDDPGETLIVPVDLACSGNRIVIDPGSSLDLYEGQTVTVSVGQLDPQNAAQTIRDLAGNAMRGRQEFTNNETWTFVVRLSEFTWARDFIVASAAYESGGTVTAKLVNGNETDVDFDLSGLPVWLTPSTASGTVVAGGSLAIGFTYPDSLGRSVIEQDPDSTATFLATVTADVVSPPLSVPLDLRIDVTCGPPAWTPDPGLYEYSMTAVLELYDDLGVQQTDPGDIVAAFVGNQLRGAAHPSADGKAYLTIYSNRSAGEIVRFRLFDAESCHVFGTASPTLRFVVDDRRTTVLTFEDTLPADLQTIEASTGWTWFSLNLEPQGGGGAMSILDVLGNVNPSPGDIVKSKTAFSIADENGEWQGALFDLDNKKGYQIRLRDGGTILHEGEPVPGDLSINLSTRWNWIGYPPAFPRPVDEVILNPTPTMGELIKSQTEFAQFDGSSWVGSLTMLEPGKGYKLYRNDGSLGGSLRFPSNPEPFARKSHGTGLSAEVALQAADGLGWTLPEQGFEYNMTLVVQVDVGGELAAGPAVVAAFVGDEVRGVAELVPVGVGKTMAFLMVHSDEPDGEAVTFQVHDLSSDELFEARNELEFRADANLGSIGSPWTVRATPLGSSQVPTSFQLYANQPNPAVGPGSTTIRYDLPRTAQVSIELFDVQGRSVLTLVDAEQPAGRYVTELDPAALVSGIYFYRMRTDGFERVRKLTVLR